MRNYSLMTDIIGGNKYFYTYNKMPSIKSINPNIETVNKSNMPSQITKIRVMFQTIKVYINRNWTITQIVKIWHSE